MVEKETAVISGIQDTDLDDEELDESVQAKKINTPVYELFSGKKLSEGEKPLGKVIGHENQKKIGRASCRERV